MPVETVHVESARQKIGDVSPGERSLGRKVGNRHTKYPPAVWNEVWEPWTPTDIYCATRNDTSFKDAPLFAKAGMCRKKFGETAAEQGVYRTTAPAP